MTDSAITTKECSKCGEVKPLLDFYKQKQGRLGRQAHCKACDKQFSRKRAEGRPKRVSLSHMTPEQRKAHNNAVVAQWKKTNRERVREINARRRAIKAGTTTGFIDLEALWDQSQGICGLCNLPIDRNTQWPDPMSPSLDHRTPLSREGTHKQENLQWTHLLCNLKKGNRPLSDLDGREI